MVEGVVRVENRLGFLVHDESSLPDTFSRPCCDLRRSTVTTTLRGQPRKHSMAMHVAARDVRVYGMAMLRSAGRLLGMVTAPDRHAHRTAPVRRLGRCPWMPWATVSDRMHTIGADRPPVAVAVEQPEGRRQTRRLLDDSEDAALVVHHGERPALQHHVVPP
jgi:hypothetical protein